MGQSNSYDFAGAKRLSRKKSVENRYFSEGSFGRQGVEFIRQAPARERPPPAGVPWASPPTAVSSKGDPGGAGSAGGTPGGTPALRSIPTRSARAARRSGRDPGCRGDSSS